LLACKETDNVPKPLSNSLFKEECIQLDYIELLQQCQQISLEVTPGECQAIETLTRKQSQSKVWYQQRAGRITASNPKSACKTNTAKPAKSLVKYTCYPEAQKFSTAATRWRREHEGRTRKAYQIEIDRCQFLTVVLILIQGSHTWELLLMGLLTANAVGWVYVR